MALLTATHARGLISRWLHVLIILAALSASALGAVARINKHGLQARRYWSSPPTQVVRASLEMRNLSFNPNSADDCRPTTDFIACFGHVSDTSRSENYFHLTINQLRNDPNLPSECVPKSKKVVIHKLMMSVYTDSGHYVPELNDRFGDVVLPKYTSVKILKIWDAQSQPRILHLLRGWGAIGDAPHFNIKLFWVRTIPLSLPPPTPRTTAPGPNPSPARKRFGWW